MGIYAQRTSHSADSHIRQIATKPHILWFTDKVAERWETDYSVHHISSSLLSESQGV